jgi:uncharacterized tellurite resistance protein B-like protein
MSPTTVIILGIILLGIIAGILVVQSRVEGFQEKESIDPQQLLSRVKRILDKIDNPELIGHMLNVVDKDPGQLARMQLNLTS